MSGSRGRTGLTADDGDGIREVLADDGFVQVCGVLPKDEVETVRRAIDEILDRYNQDSDILIDHDDVPRKICYPLGKSECLLAVLAHPSLGRVVEAAYERRFVRTFGYYEGLAAVAGMDGWHHITTDGSDAYAERYAWCGNVQGGRCTVREPGGAYLHIEHDGSPVYRERWRYAGDYRDGVAVVQAADGCSTHIDRDGRLLHGRWFVDLDVFHKGFARARDQDGWTHVDTSGRPIHARRFAAVEPFYNGQARVERFDGALEVIDESAASLVELRPPRRGVHE